MPMRTLKAAGELQCPHLYRLRMFCTKRARKAKRDKDIDDYWSFDGRIVIKDVSLRGKVHTIGKEVASFSFSYIFFFFLLLFVFTICFECCVFHNATDM